VANAELRVPATPDLLERDPLLDELEAGLEDARGGSGRLVFVGGEAGVGKTSLVRAFGQRARARVVTGACDNLATPTPLGPFRDVAAQIGGPLAESVDARADARIDQPGVGGMGIHLLKPGLLDATVDAAQPEALVYAPADNGQMKLAALEYIVFKQAWEDANGADAAPPSLFGRPFLLTPAPNRFGIPTFYALHSWIWKPNPTGNFEPWNPRVTCP
jgi:hypothetical protein